jgi:hypothetical protein
MSWPPNPTLPLEAIPVSGSLLDAPRLVRKPILSKALVAVGLCVFILLLWSISLIRENSPVLILVVAAVAACAVFDESRRLLKERAVVANANLTVGEVTSFSRDRHGRGFLAYRYQSIDHSEFKGKVIVSSRVSYVPGANIEVLYAAEDFNKSIPIRELRYFDKA